MRNLKRVLALAMALVMILGMMVIGSSAASYSDAAAIDADYAEAVEILSGMGIFKGTGAGFGPKQILDRASAAALVYRVITGDVKDKQIALYDYSSFADVAEGVWYTPYITYAANGGFIKGYNGNAMPNDTVTGIQVLAMMLRAAGYGQNGEFEGAAWKDGILTVAKELGITAGISTNDLDKGASRELVAQLIFNAITGAKIVAYSPILNDYIPVTVSVDKDGKVGVKGTQTLGEKVFALTSEADHDNWGRPVTNWFADNFKKGTAGSYDYLKETLYATIEATPDATYVVATSECDIAKDLGLRVDAVVSALTVNGEATTVNFGGNKEIDLTAMNKIGAQGRLVEFYYDVVSKTYEVVMIDEFLASVKDVTEVEYDKNGHIKFYAALTLTVYGYGDIVLESNENWEYTKGEKLLVYWDVDKAYGDEYVEFLGTPDSLIGAQTAFSNKANTHVVEGTEYPDAVQFKLDEAFKEISDHTWYFDTYGNLIGAEDIDTLYNYGVISAIKWYENDSLLDDGYAIANITYMDGTTEKATIAAIGDADFTESRNGLSEEASENTEWVRTALFEIETTKKGLVLNATTPLEGATTETGRPALNTEMDAGKKTQFLVWNKITKKYETYTGIANIPSYKSAEAFWCFDKVMGRTGDGVAEYVFINAPVAVGSAKEALYFIPGNLTITANMHPILDKVNYYTITGGYVDGVKGALTVLPGAEGKITDNEIYTKLVANTGKLVGLTIENGFVTSVVNAEALGMINFTGTYADYVGAVNTDVTLSNQGVLKAGTQSYDVEGAELISTVGSTLSGIFASDKIGRVDAYLYVVYTYDYEVPGNYTKTAKYIYASNVKGEDYVVEPEVDLYKEAVEAAKAAKTEDELLAAKTALTKLTGLTDEQKAYVADLIADVTYKLDVIEAQDAVDTAKKAVADAKAAKDKAAEDRKVTYKAEQDAAAAVTKAEAAVTTAEGKVPAASTVNDAAKALADAEKAVADAEVTLTKAQAAVEGKYAALVEANKGTDQTAIDAAQTAYDTALTAQTAAEKALADAEADLTAKETALANAEKALADAKAAVEAAKADLTAAQKALDAASAADDAAQKANDKAKTDLETAQKALADAEKALADLKA